MKVGGIHEVLADFVVEAGRVAPVVDAPSFHVFHESLEKARTGSFHLQKKRENHNHEDVQRLRSVSSRPAF